MDLKFCLYQFKTILYETFINLVVVLIWVHIDVKNLIGINKIALSYMVRKSCRPLSKLVNQNNDPFEEVDVTRRLWFSLPNVTAMVQYPVPTLFKGTFEIIKWKCLILAFKNASYAKETETFLNEERDLQLLFALRLKSHHSIILGLDWKYRDIK